MKEQFNELTLNELKIIKENLEYELIALNIELDHRETERIFEEMRTQ